MYVEAVNKNEKNKTPTGTMSFILFSSRTIISYNSYTLMQSMPMVHGVCNTPNGSTVQQEYCQTRGNQYMIAKILYVKI